MSQTVRSSTIYFALLLGSVAVALIPVLLPGLDLAVAAYFLQPGPPWNPGKWLWVELINEHIPTVFRGLAILCLAVWMVARVWPRWRRWSLPAAFVGLALLMGPGLLVGALKDYTLRARPFHVTEFGGTQQFTPAWVATNQCDDNCAFVSGHTADGFFLVGLMLLHRRRRWWWVAAGIFWGGVIGFARVAVGAHWLSDVLWALPVTLVATGLVWLCLRHLDRTGEA